MKGRKKNITVKVKSDKTKYMNPYFIYINSGLYVILKAII